MGTILSVNIFFASAPVLDKTPNLESLEVVAKLTVSEDAMKLKPDRLFLR
jgi:hypothetical protein